MKVAFLVYTNPEFRLLLEREDRTEEFLRCFETAIDKMNLGPYRTLDTLKTPLKILDVIEYDPYVKGKTEKERLMNALAAYQRCCYWLCGVDDLFRPGIDVAVIHTSKLGNDYHELYASLETHVKIANKRLVGQYNKDDDVRIVWCYVDYHLPVDNKWDMKIKLESRQHKFDEIDLALDRIDFNLDFIGEILDREFNPKIELEDGGGYSYKWKETIDGNLFQNIKTI